MRLCVAATLIALGIACATRDAGLIKTQVVTYPEGAIVQYKGHSLGRSPTDIILPQDTMGHLAERTEVRVIPNTAQPHLYAQTRVFDPSNNVERIPNRIMIDMTLHDTNSVPATNALVTSTEELSEPRSAQKPKPVDRGKPTQAIGIDRWSPGIY
jgi:hypothetical protein